MERDPLTVLEAYVILLPRTLTKHLNRGSVCVHPEAEDVPPRKNSSVGFPGYLAPGGPSCEAELRGDSFIGKILAIQELWVCLYKTQAGKSVVFYMGSTLPLPMHVKPGKSILMQYIQPEMKVINTLK